MKKATMVKAQNKIFPATPPRILKQHFADGHSNRGSGPAGFQKMAWPIISLYSKKAIV
ncbi:MAG: hypothetical protein ACE5HS_05335 [bacterium]